MVPSFSNDAEALTAKFTTDEPDEELAGNATISQYLATIGRQGGIKGGKARAAKLSGERKSEIARIAAAARWKGHRNDNDN